jgi:hypothetical protein
VVCRGWSPVVAVGLSLLSLLMTGCGSAEASRPTTSGTQVVVLWPTTRSGSLAAGYTVAKTVNGSCVIGSLLTSGLRCNAGEYELCWPMADRKTAACLPTASTIVVRVRTKGLPGPFVFSEPANLVRSNFPWPVALQLTSGIKCLSWGGAPGVFDGKVARYGCAGTNMWLLQQISMGGPRWSCQTALLNRQHTAYSAGPTVFVERAFYA